jgi:hypothetical protein
MESVLHGAMDTRDAYRLTHIFKLLGSRIIPAYFFSQNPMEFVKWQFNACRQTALISAYFLKKLLESNNSTHVQVRLWDGEFKDICTSWYNHAWITGSVPGETYIVFIDVARVSTYPIVNFSTMYDNPVNNSEALKNCGTVMLKRTPLNYDEMLTQSEYYTGKTGLEVCKDIEKMMHRYGYRLENYPWEYSIPF